MSRISSLFKRLVRLNEGSDTPPWQIQLWDDTEQTWRSLGSTATGGSPLLTNGLDRYPVSEALAFPGDPPDLINYGGDALYLRSWQPAFLTTDRGDLVIAEGLD